MEELWRSMGLPARVLAMAALCAVAWAVGALFTRTRKKSETPGEIDAKWAGLPAPPSFRLYTERQIVVMTVLFTPLAGGLLLRSNLRRLGEKSKARLAMLFSIGVLVGIFAVSVVLSRVISAGGGGLGFEFAAAGSMHWAFKHWMGEPMQAHLTAGGQVASPLRAFAVGVLPFAALASPFVAFFLFLQATGCVRVHSSFVCAGDEPSRADVHEFAESMRKSEAFQKGGTVLVSLAHRSDGWLQADFSLDDAELKDPQVISRLDSLAGEVIEDVYRERKVILFACHEQRDCRRLQKPSPPPAKTISPLRTLTPAQVRDELLRNRAAMQRCVDDALQRDPKLNVGKVRIAATVARSGRVEKASISDRAVDASELGGCLKQATKDVVFPAFDGDPFEVNIPVIVTRP